MPIESLDIGLRMCNRVVQMIEAGKSVEDLEEYFGTQKYYYKSLLREGTGRSQSDWDMEEEQFVDMLDSPDEPAIKKMVADEPMSKPKAKAKPKRKAKKDEPPKVVAGMMSSSDIRR